MLLAVISQDTELLIPIGVLCTAVGGLIVATWRVANALRDNSQKMKGLTEELRSTWSFRDQEKWALNMERENRARGYQVWVPDVKRAPKEEE